ncbi:MAG: DUF3108 domain-containing protein [Thiohalophilus sp.]|jgi:hypothetical protein
MPRLLYILIALLFSGPVFSEASLSPFTLEYNVSKNDFHLGSNRHELKHLQDELYLMQAVTKAEGVVALFFSETVEETSRFRLVDGKVKPLHYRYHKSGKDPETFEVDFDYQAGELRHSLIDKIHPLKPIDQDLLSFQVAMMIDLQQSVRPLEYRIADKKRIETYKLIPRGEKVFDTQLGKMHTVIMEYYDKKRKRTYRFWCAKELGYLPYRSRRIEEDGDIILLQMRRYNGKPAEPLEE